MGQKRGILWLMAQKINTYNINQLQAYIAKTTMLKPQIVAETHKLSHYQGVSLLLAPTL